MNEEYDGWCYEERVPFSFEDLGNDAWLTGCPLCGGTCFVGITEEQEKEENDFWEGMEI